MPDFIPDYAQKAINDLRDEVETFRARFRILSFLVFLMFGYLAYFSFNSREIVFRYPTVYANQECVVYFNKKLIVSYGPFVSDSIFIYKDTKPILFEEIKVGLRNASDCSDVERFLTRNRNLIQLNTD